MQYKTIVLELLEQHPALHEKLRASNSLLSTMNQMATELRSTHLAITKKLQSDDPTASDAQLKSEALEVALQQLQSCLPMEDSETFSLDLAMDYLRRHTPPG